MTINLNLNDKKLLREINIDQFPKILKNKNFKLIYGKFKKLVDILDIDPRMNRNEMEVIQKMFELIQTKYKLFKNEAYLKLYNKIKK